YPYGYNQRENMPMYRRLPTDQEAAMYESGRAPPRPRPRPRSPHAPDAPPAPSPSDARAHAPPLPRSLMAPTPHLTADDADGPGPGVHTLASLMGEQGSVLMRLMERGFYVSLDREVPKGERSYWRTQSNGFIPSQGLKLVQGSDFHGTELQEIALPIAFVM